MRVKRIAFGVCLSALIATAPALITPAAAQDCVRVVRSISHFTLQGDGWMWWNRAAGVHARDTRPMVGSVLVFKRSGRLGRGHVSLVSHIIDRRNIEVDHSWLGGRGLRRGMRVTDVSAANDWSAVRVWHEPTAQLGMRVYPTYGFVLPLPARDQDRIEVADSAPYSIAPAGRARLHRSAAASIRTASLSGHVMPARKPSSVAVAFRIQGNPERSVHAVALTSAVLPSRKPTTARQFTVKERVVAALPVRKPVQRAELVAARFGD